MTGDDLEGSISFGESVQRRRNVLSMTRAELARRVGCSSVTIKKIERGERRPSQQIAELLADHLLIPAPERNRFVRMARGEVDPSSLARQAEQARALPTFLQTPSTSPTSEDFPFVAREAELAQLQMHLDQALHGSGQVVFITGEAGCGKSALAQEFARRSQQAHADLVVVAGHCNTHTGTGDPYLPFRQILDLLTGDTEFQAAASKLHPDHARRLWQIMPTTLQTLVEIGRELFGTFIPTRRLLNRLAGYIYAGASELAPLHQLITALAEKENDATSQGHAQQTMLFEQYSRVMLTVARQAPLLLILDDLQWADAGSINLLFHLGRHRAGRRILIVGIYRPADVALGRDGGRHPLEPVVNELQRHFGNSPIELSQSEGRAFVDALLDAQPNRLGVGFRDALFLQTGGHALFAVEMLRGLQEQGGVVQDGQGQWVEGSYLDWSNLPARVEGIIKERLERLPPSLQESLKIAAVEGEIFTAEVVAGVQGIEARTLIGQLSNVLDKQQDLIRLLGIRRVDGDGHTLCHYRFRHILFQRFLYDSLDEAERVYLHQAVGQEMEQLYAGQTDVMALQLARHFVIAGDEMRALVYYVTAGDVAAAAYANTEAVAHYRGAMNIVRRIATAGTTVIHLYTQLGRVLELNSQFDEAFAIYGELNQLARIRGNRTMELSAVTAQSTLYITLTPLHDPGRGQVLLEEALLLARVVGDQAAEAKILGNLATLHLYAGRAAQGVAYGEQSLALARSLDLREQMAFTLNNLGLSYYSICHTQQSKATLHEAQALWRQLGNMPMLADSLSSACTVYLYSGEYEQAIAFSQEAFEISQAAGNLWGQAYSRTWVGYAYWQLGAPDAAVGMMEESIRLAELAGFAVPLAFTRADLALVLGALGAMGHGLALAQEALAVAERQVPLFRFHVLTRLAQLHLWQDDLSAAEACIQRANHKDLEKPPAFYYATLVTEAELALRRDDYQRATAILDGVLSQLRSFSVRIFLPRALYLQAHASLGLGQKEAAQANLQEARAEATATGAGADLWPILVSLSQLEKDPTAAERLRRQAQAIVESIAAHTPTPELRTAFLSLPKVRAVFEPATKQGAQGVQANP
jgi:transcriptional regulator with XRE-family HTH domain/tetratricopeptide (TPR) repeat protein